MSNSTFNDGFILAKHRDGVKLIKPEYQRHYTTLQRLSSVADVMRLPYNVYFLDKYDSQLLLCNEIMAEHTGVTSPAKLKGMNVMDVMDYHSGRIVISNDRWVLSSERLLVREEVGHVPALSVQVQALSFKMPCYSEDNTLLGLFGVGIPIDQLIAQGVSDVINYYFLNRTNSNSQSLIATNQTKTNGPFLSKREIECLFWAANGKTAQEIAIILDLSALTIETYFKNIVRKLDAKNRTHAIVKAIYAKYI